MVVYRNRIPLTSKTIHDIYAVGFISVKLLYEKVQNHRVELEYINTCVVEDRHGEFI